MNREELILGESLMLNSGLVVRHFTVMDILSMKFNNYVAFTNYFVLKPQDLIVQLWGKGIYYEEIEQYELFMMQIEEDSEYFFNMFKIFTNCEDVWLDYIPEMESNAVCYSTEKGKFYLTYEAFDVIYAFFKEMRMHTHSNKRYFAGEKTRKVILDEDFEEYEMDLKSNKNKHAFSDMISFLVISNKRDWADIYSYPIARFNEEYIKTYKKQQVDYLMFGIYTGSVDSTKVNKNSLEWFKT